MMTDSERPRLLLSTIGPLEFPRDQQVQKVPAAQETIFEGLDIDPREIIGTDLQYRTFLDKKQKLLSEFREYRPRYSTVESFLASDKGKIWSEKYIANEQQKLRMASTEEDISRTTQVVKERGLGNRYVLDKSGQRLYDENGNPFTYDRYLQNMRRTKGVENGEIIIPDMPLSYKPDVLSTWENTFLSRIPTEVILSSAQYDEKGEKIDLANIPSDPYTFVMNNSNQRMQNVTGRRNLLKHIFGLNDEDFLLKSNGDLQFKDPGRIDFSKANIPEDAFLELKNRFYNAMDKSNGKIKEEDFAKFTEDYITSLVNTQTTSSRTSQSFVDVFENPLSEALLNASRSGDSALSNLPDSNEINQNQSVEYFDEAYGKSWDDNTIINLKYIDENNVQHQIDPRDSKNGYGVALPINNDHILNKTYSVFSSNNLVQGLSANRAYLKPEVFAATSLKNAVNVATGQVLDLSQTPNAVITRFEAVTKTPKRSQNGEFITDENGNYFPETNYIVEIAIPKSEYLRMDILRMNAEKSPIDTKLATTLIDGFKNLPKSFGMSKDRWIKKFQQDADYKELANQLGLNADGLYDFIQKKIAEGKTDDGNYLMPKSRAKLVAENVEGRRLTVKEAEDAGFKIMSKSGKFKTKLSNSEETLIDIIEDSRVNENKKGIVYFKVLVPTKNFTAINYKTTEESAQEQLLQERKAQEEALRNRIGYAQDSY